MAVRKTVGASRQRLFAAFLVESALFTLAAFVVSFALDWVILTQLDHSSRSGISFFIPGRLQGMTIAVPARVTLALLAGLYPATVLSSFDPIQALRSGQLAGKSSGLGLALRRGLTVFRFAISSFMIVCAFSIRQQMQFIARRDLGFDKEHVVTLPLIDEARGRYGTLKEEMLRLPEVQQASVSSVVPGRRVVYLTVRIPDLAGKKNSAETEPDGTTNMRVLSVDGDFVKTIGLQIVAGRDFSTTSTADIAGSFLLNEAAVKEFGLTDAVGRPFEFVY